MQKNDELSERYALNNELHARPFPRIKPSSQAFHLAIKKTGDFTDNTAERAQLLALLDRFGATHPAPGASHFSGQIGRNTLKWEVHTEFVTYTIFSETNDEKPFHRGAFDVFPDDWLANAPGETLISAIVLIEPAKNEVERDEIINTRMRDWFVPESLAVSSVVDGEATIAGDFRIDENGHSRFVVLTNPKIGQQRLGRIVQRILEIATYQAVSMLTFPIARDVAARVLSLSVKHTELVQDIAAQVGDDGETLNRLLSMSAEIELLSSTTSYRFSAAGAYEAIVNHRIQVLRETRIGGRQLFSEFMMRRYDPAMRTCRSAEERLANLSARAQRSADLLRTRVDVKVGMQSSQFLRQLDKRAEVQLRLQETVEGLSVVAISYYAVSLIGYLMGPVEKLSGYSKSTLVAAITIPVLLLVIYGLRRIRNKVEAHNET